LTDHPYIREVEAYGRKERVFATAAFTADLAWALGARVEKPGDTYDAGRIRHGALTLYVHGSRAHPLGRVEISAGAPELTRRLIGRLPQFPSITLDAARPLDRLAADVRRRLVAPSDVIHAGLQDALAAQEAHRKNCEARVAELRAIFPTIQLDFTDDRTTSARLYANGGGCYLAGRLESDGGLYVDRVGGVPAERATAFLRALLAPITKES
jgi:hypothetical protein